MADRVSASITVGGALTADLFSDLVDLVVAEDLSTEWDGPVFEGNQREPGEPLRLFGREVAWGRFDLLETWCVENGVAFTRWSDGCNGSFGPERVVFRGSGETSCYAADEEDQIVVHEDTIRGLGSYEALLAHFQAAAFEVPPLTVEGDPTSTGTEAA